MPNFGESVLYHVIIALPDLKHFIPKQMSVNNVFVLYLVEICV